jgi:hypothetical protein
MFQQMPVPTAYFSSKRLQLNIQNEHCRRQAKDAGTSLASSNLSKIPAFGIVNCVAGFGYAQAAFI